MESILIFLNGVIIGVALSMFSPLTFEVKKIFNCFGQLYLTRIILVRFPSGAKLMLNYFHRSDEDRHLHDHPWDFTSFILWRGYIEVLERDSFSIQPLQTIKRPAQWKHRVVLKDGKPALTLVFTGPNKREWGYHTPEGWISHTAWWRKENCV